MKYATGMREAMVEKQLVARGIRDPAVLAAMREVPREEFVARALVEFAYEDSPLPIEEEQTISQPYIVALMAEALEVRPGDRIFEVGTGSGFAAAVLSRIAGEVYTIERHLSLARTAEERFRRLGYANVHVRHGDGTLGWPEHAPYDAIVVAAAGPEVPKPLLDQLAIGGRLVIPVGPTPRLQNLVRLTRLGPEEYQREELGGVRFVPLIGARGFAAGTDAATAWRRAARKPESGSVRSAVEPFSSIAAARLEPLLERIGDARIVLLGEATHGTAEFYDMRARITRELVERGGFQFVAVEADWPDAAWVDRYVRGASHELPLEKPFTRFPTWMWANEQVLAFVEWLAEHNRALRDPEHAVGFFGLDLYSLDSSIAAVLGYLDRVDPEAARVARYRYGCLSPWEGDPATYGRAAVSGRYADCEQEVAAMLRDLLARRAEYSAQDGRHFLDAAQNAKLVANAERYYRVMYHGAGQSWNLRDSHMFETLEALLRFHGPRSKGIVWAHNSHVGDAAATEMGARGEHNIGQLCRERFAQGAFSVGFGTDHGTVAAASDWDGPMEIKTVRPSHLASYEALFHDSGSGAFLLPLRAGRARDELLEERLERAIGVIYRPETELESHYFQAALPRQFDEYVWFDVTRAVTPLRKRATAGVPDTFPFGL